MDATELQAIKSRVAQAESLTKKIRSLEEGIQKLWQLAVLELHFPHDDWAGKDIRYSMKRNVASSCVCWAGNHEGLLEEIRTAIEAILKRRLDELQAELKNT